MRLLPKFMLACIAVLFSAIILVQQPPRAQGAGSVPYIGTMDEMHSVLGSTPVPVLVQFDATWCGYCRALRPHIQKLHDSTSRAALLVYKVDADSARDVVTEFGVSSFPTLFIIQKGEIIAMARGGMNEKELFDWVKQNLRGV